jgi:hypothetical protein
MKSRWLRRALAAVIAVSSSVIFIPASHAADAFSWTVPSALAGKAGYSSALSNDGTVMLIGESSTGLYLSTDTGTTFTQVSSPAVTGTRYAVAVSGDGQKMFAVNYSDTSVAYSLDGGSTWSLSTNGVAINAGAACMSSDGSVWMTGGLNSANAYVSTNNGTSWTSISSVGTGSWRACALSSNGTKRYFINNGTYLWISSNSGTSWAQSSYYIVGANCVTASDDGGTVIQTSSTGYVYRSTSPLSGGFTSFAAAYGGGSSFAGCSMSGTGSVLVVGRVNNGVRLSVDSGVTWADEVGTGSNSWNNVSISRDGKKIIALSNAAVGNYIGTYTPPIGLSLGIGAASVLTYRTANTITAIGNYPGKVTFYANEKKIGKCVAVPTVALVATCPYSPTIHGVVKLTAKLVATDTSKGTITSPLFTTSINKRTNTR